MMNINKQNLDVEKRVNQDMSSRDNYDPDHIPCDFDQAEQHRLSMRVGETEKNAQNPRMSMSNGRPVDIVPLDYWCDTHQLDFLGPGYPMFFEFIKYSIYMLIVLILSAGSYNFFSNSQGADCLTQDELVSGEHNDNQCVSTWATKISLANKRRNQDMNNLQEILNMFSIGAIIVLLQLFRHSQRETIEICDHGDISPDDYTVMVKKIPKEIQDPVFQQNPDYDDYIKHYFEAQFNVTVEAVNIGFNLSELNQMKAQKLKLIKDFQKALSTFYKKKTWPGPKTREEMQNDINKVERECDILCNKYSEAKKADVAKYWTGWAWVSFQTEQEKDKILELAEKSNGFYFPQGQKVTKISVDEATQPSEVFWENLHYTTMQKFIRRFFGFLITLLTILICFLIIFYLAQMQNQYAKMKQAIIKAKPHLGSGLSHLAGTVTSGAAETGSTETSSDQIDDMQDDNQDNLFKIQMIALVISIIIPTLNKVIIMIMGYVSDMEKYSSRTEHSQVLASRLATAMFFNTAIQTFLIKVVIPWLDDGPADARNTIISPSGLIQNQQMVFLMNSFLTPALYFLDGGRLFKKLYKWWVIKHKDTCTMTQAQLNVLFEDPNYNIALRYAYVLNSMFITAFYAPLIPIVLIWTVLGLTFTYFLDKYKLLRHSVVYYNMGKNLSVEMTEVLEGFLPIFCVGYWMFTYLVVHTVNLGYESKMYDGNLVFTNMYLAAQDLLVNSSWYCVLAILVGFTHMMLPMQWVNEKILPVKKANPNKKMYQKALANFETNYNLENPATREKARVEAQKKQQSLQTMQNMQSIPANQNAQYMQSMQNKQNMQFK